MRVLVCGGRDFADSGLLTRTLDSIDGITTIIEGGAKGADRLAGLWSVSRGVDHHVFYADWTNDGRAAGPIRNSRMLKDGKPDLVVAFRGGAGTADMVRKAKAAGVRVVEP